MTITINTVQAARLLPRCMAKGLVPMLTGSPGIGKSGIAKQIAATYNLKLIDIRLSEYEPTDLTGFPQTKGKKAGYLPMETFPIKGDEIPAGYDGWLLFLDEFNSSAVDQGVQSAAYKLTLDRMVGNHELHEKLAMMCAGNLMTNGPLVAEMSPAQVSRLIHFELIVDYLSWLIWAAENKIDHRITDYIKFKPCAVYTYKPNFTEKTYACPRTWEFLNRFMDDLDIYDLDTLPLVAGTISDGVALEFIAFIKIYDQLPKIAEIKLSPNTILIPEQPSILYAMTGSLAHNINKDNIEQLMKYINRLPIEFQVITLRDTLRTQKELKSNPSVQQWLSTSAVKLF